MPSISTCHISDLQNNVFCRHHCIGVPTPRTHEQETENSHGAGAGDLWGDHLFSLLLARLRRRTQIDSIHDCRREGSGNTTWLEDSRGPNACAYTTAEGECARSISPETAECGLAACRMGG